MELQFGFIFEKGGPVVIILLILSIYALAVFLLKLYHFMAERLFSSQKFVQVALQRIENRQLGIAATELSRYRHPVAKVMERAIRLAETESEKVVQAEVERAGRLHLEYLASYVRGLDAVAHLSPLLGLLGTVLGMIQAFMQLQAAGVQVDVAMLAGGIWEALLTTAVGLAVAIPALAAVNWIESVVERVRQDMGDSVTRTMNAIRKLS